MVFDIFVECNKEVSNTQMPQGLMQKTAAKKQPLNFTYRQLSDVFF